MVCAYCVGLQIKLIYSANQLSLLSKSIEFTQQIN